MVQKNFYITELVEQNLWLGAVALCLFMTFIIVMLIVFRNDRM